MLFVCYSCDADPLTLAKYVVALVKKDKTEAELRDLCSRELDVFLQDSRFILRFMNYLARNYFCMIFLDI